MCIYCKTNNNASLNVNIEYWVTGIAKQDVCVKSAPIELMLNITRNDLTWVWNDEGLTVVSSFKAILRYLKTLGINIFTGNIYYRKKSWIILVLYPIFSNKIIWVVLSIPHLGFFKLAVFLTVFQKKIYGNSKSFSFQWHAVSLIIRNKYIKLE